MQLEQWIDTKIGQDIWHKKYQFENETFDEWLDRVSGKDEKIRQLIIEKKFLPGGRILANRGLQNKGRKITYSNCYVVTPPEDNIESIFDCAKNLARTYSYGGGCGTDISKLSPKGAKIRNAAKETSGAVSFMDLYSLVTELIGMNGRRGALMLSIICNHPDLLDFIDIKNNPNKITKANISIKITNEFMKAVEENKDFTLSFTRKETGEVSTKIINTRKIFHKIAESNWRMAEPGFLMWDRINSWNLLSEDSEFEYASCNPCGEEPLPAGGSCLISSFNLSAYILNPFTSEANFDFLHLEEDTRNVVNFMNVILDEGWPLHPLQEQRDSVGNYRQIGIGIMGLADMFIKLGLKYGNSTSLDYSNLIGLKLIDTAIDQSAELAKLYGTYPKYNSEAVLKSPFLKFNTSIETRAKVKKYGLRNSQLLTIAPTGSLSNLLGISGGIEPIFDYEYTRMTESLHGENQSYTIKTPIVNEYMKLKNITDIKDLPDFFVTSKKLFYKERINIQATWQNHIDASISSTINVPNNFTIEQIEDLYIYAWTKQLKGVTIYREGCEREGILNREEQSQLQLQRGEIIKAPEAADGVTYKYKSGCGNVYINITYDENGNINQTFTNKGSSGTCRSNQEAVSRLISLALRGGISIDDVIDQLQSVDICASYVGARASGKLVSKGASCPHAIANLLEKAKIEIGEKFSKQDFKQLYIPYEDLSQEFESVFIDDNSQKCPECGEPLIHEMGCVQCKMCGFSKCG